VISIIHAIERLNIWIGRSFGWCILILTLSVAYEVFVRYVINAPTVWAFDMMVQMYGALFLMAGPYALAQDTHVRADVVYRFLQPRWQGLVDIFYISSSFFRACSHCSGSVGKLPQTHGVIKKSVGTVLPVFKFISLKP